MDPKCQHCGGGHENLDCPRLTRTDKQLPCIACGTVPEAAIDGEDYQPYAATEFSSGGHYGSTAFDPSREGLRLVLNVCDKCLVKRAGRTVLRRTKRPARSEVEYTPWDPKAFL